MRVFNRAHVPWAIFVVLATIVACWLYAGNFAPRYLPAGLQLPAGLVQKPSDHRSIGGTPLGLMFGAIALAIFIFAALLGVRKRLVLWRIGTVQRWLRAHIWLSLLSIPLVILHSGFRLGGPMTTLLIVLYFIVMVSGLYGLALQQQMPRIMMERLPTESVYEQIPHIRGQLYAAAEKMRAALQPATSQKIEADAAAPNPAKAATAGTIAAETVVSPTPPNASSAAGVADPGPRPAAAATTARVLETAPPAATTAPAAAAKTDADSEAALLDFLDRQILPYLQAKRGERFRLGNARFSEDTFRFVKLRVTESYRDRVEEIQGWCDERRMLDLQTKLHHWLHGWLFIHAPFSFILLILTVWHAFVTLFYY